MGFFKKLILGGLGWSLFGPIGGLVGIVVASLFDGKDHENATKRIAADKTANNGNDFQIVLLVLFASVMKADGRVVKSELASVKRILLQNYGEDGALEALQILKRLLQEDIDVLQVATQCGVYLSYSARLQLLHMLFELAASDGEINSQEADLLRNIAQYMRLSEQDTASISAMFANQTNKDWAYEVLEIEPDCSDEELKKAYRRMAMKYHPDKVSNLGEEVKQNATEKFRRVKEAYDTIKKQRGI